MEQTFKNIEERYSIFSENELSIICDKAIYDFDPKTSIIRFLNDPKAVADGIDNTFGNWNSLTTVYEFYDFTKRMAEEYVKWIQLRTRLFKNKKVKTDEDKIQLHNNLTNFFKGFFAELFIYWYFQFDNTILVDYNNIDKKKMIKITEFALRLNDENDEGCDGSCNISVNGTSLKFPAAIQIKGHNPEKTLIKDKYTSRLYSDAAPEHIIPFEILNDENIRDMVIITFARPDKLVYSENVKRHARLFNRVLVLDGSHFNQFADVWQSIYEKFQNLK